MPLPPKHFYMIRHGETEANAARIMAGSLDSPLTEQGRQQAKQASILIEALEIKPKAIVHSNLQRARDTAIIINEALDVPLHEDENLAELHAGDWEGVPYEECKELLSGWPTPPNGESFVDFCRRIQVGKRENLNKHDGPILIVSHGGVFRGLGGLYGLQTPGIFRNCHLYEFVPKQQEQDFPWQVWSHLSANDKEETRVYHESERITQPMI